VRASWRSLDEALVLAGDAFKGLDAFEGGGGVVVELLD
jgi:hypothetical protein